MAPLDPVSIPFSHKLKMQLADNGGADMACTIGIDFGTQSARAVLACTNTGEILAQAQAEYAHPLTESALVYGEDYDKALC